MNSAFLWFPVLAQLENYSKDKCVSDVIAAVVVTVMLIPQSLAYSMLAGLPPHYGLYASIVPIVIYSLLGTSTSLAVGPVAIASIMTASALSTVVDAGLISYVDGAITLAFLSGSILFLLGVFRFGFVANFLSHSVVSGFITASGLIIALSQLKHLLGVSASGHTFFELVFALSVAVTDTHFLTALIGSLCLVFLMVSRRYASVFLQKLGVQKPIAIIIARMFPILAVCVSTALVATFSLNEFGVAIVGDIPTGLADPKLPALSMAAAQALILPAFFIAIIGYVESISVGRTLGAKRNERVDSNQELIALGGANLASAVAGAFPVTGGFSRSVVNFDSGAQTQLAGIYTAVGISVAALFLTPYLYYLPIVMLAATIVVAVLALVDFSIFRRAWQFSKSDFLAVFLTVTITLLVGVEAGVASGIIASVLLHLYYTSTPHIAEVGLVLGTEHFRNVKHYQVSVAPQTVSLRIDESLLFSNATFLETFISALVNHRPQLEHVILHFGAVNTIDLTAMEMLEKVNKDLLKKGIKLHLSEVKLPVKSLLEKTDFIAALGGNLYMTHLQAYNHTLKPNVME